MLTVDANAEQPFDLNHYLNMQRARNGNRSSLEPFCKLAAPKGRFQPADEIKEEYEYRPYPKMIEVDGTRLLVNDEAEHNAILAEIRRRDEAPQASASGAGAPPAGTGSASTAAAGGEDEASEYARLAKVLRDAGHSVHANSKLASLRERVAALKSGE